MKLLLLYRLAPSLYLMPALLNEWVVWFEGLAESVWGPFWLFVLAFAESSFFPIPPDVLLIALLLTEGYLGAWGWGLGLALVCSVGSVLGGLAGYAIGYYGGRRLLERLVSEERVQYLDDLFARYDVWAVGIAGFTPVPYKVFTIAAGAFQLNVPRFALASALSRSARFFIVAVIILLLGEAGKNWIANNFALSTLLAAAAIVVGYILYRLSVTWWKRRTARRQTDAVEPQPTPRPHDC
jgi:membrane protein YqaA with SNARE-associated domain